VSVWVVTVITEVDSSAVIAHDRRRELRERGMLHLPGALRVSEVERLTAAIDRVHAGECAPNEPMHLLGGIGRDDAFLQLLDHPAVFPIIWGELGWNIHLYHCHLDATPPRGRPRARPHWGWHQDGGRQNLDLECDPRPRLSLKVAYWLSDVSESGRGNMLVIPGSHERNTLSRPSPGRFEEPQGAEPILAAPGDALIFDRRLWHSRSDNLSELTRKAVFLAYSYRWIRPRDEFDVDRRSARFRRLSPVRRQLLGDDEGTRSHWGLPNEPVPLRVELDRRGLLDPAIPSHR
jgi:phytanoyl-CoA dioxygenase PhyH